MYMVQPFVGFIGNILIYTDVCMTLSES